MGLGGGCDGGGGSRVGEGRTLMYIEFMDSLGCLVPLVALVAFF